MNEKNSITNQFGWCQNTCTRIEEFEEMIINVANSYDAINDELKNTSVFGEFQKKIEKRQEAFREEMNKLISQLHRDNLDYVNKQSHRLQQELSNL